MTDTELINWLEAQFTGKFRNSIFIANDLFGEGLTMESKLSPGVIHRASTVRGLIEAAAQQREVANHGL